MSKKYIFIGNRFSVLKMMLEMKLLLVEVLVVKDSFLEKELIQSKITYQTFISKEELIKKIEASNFDVLVSNGCPYILPVSKIKKKHQVFINIHPSLLPDLKGINPINGAILFNRNAGVTCHIMDDGIDTGKIISQINLGRHSDVGMLYQLSFLAEAQVFKNALKKNFIPLSNQNAISNPIYFSRKEKDLVINFNEDLSTIIRRIQAFGIKSQGAYFTYKGKKFIVLRASKIKNNFLEKRTKQEKSGCIVLKSEDSIIIKLHDGFILLDQIISNIEYLKVGDVIYNKKSK